MFPLLPGQSGYNKWLRKLAATMAWLVTALARQTSIAGDEVWAVDPLQSSAPGPARP